MRREKTSTLAVIQTRRIQSFQEEGFLWKEQIETSQVDLLFVPSTWAKSVLIVALVSLTVRSVFRVEADVQSRSVWSSVRVNPATPAGT
jgi:hypothetical protein